MNIVKINDRYARIKLTQDDVIEFGLNKFIGTTNLSNKRIVRDFLPFERVASTLYTKENPDCNAWVLESALVNDADNSVDVVLRISKDVRSQIFSKPTLNVETQKDKVKSDLSSKDKNNILLNKDRYMENVIFLNSKTASVSVSGVDFSGTEAEVTKLARHIGQYGNVTAYKIIPGEKTAKVILRLQEDAEDYLIKHAYAGISAAEGEDFGHGHPKQEPSQVDSLRRQLREINMKKAPLENVAAPEFTDEEMNEIYNKYAPTPEDIGEKELYASLAQFEKIASSIEQGLIDSISSGKCSLKEASAVYENLLTHIANIDGPVIVKSEESDAVELNDDDKSVLDKFYDEFAPKSDPKKYIAEASALLAGKVASSEYSDKKSECAIEYLVAKFAAGYSPVETDNRYKDSTGENERYDFVNSIPAELKLEFSGALSRIYSEYADGSPEKEEAIKALVQSIQSKMDAMPKESAPSYITLVSQTDNDIVGYIEYKLGENGAIVIEDYDGNSAFLKPILYAIEENPNFSIDDVQALGASLDEPISVVATDEKPNLTFELGYGESNIDDISNVSDIDDADIDDAEIDNEGNIQKISLDLNSVISSLAQPLLQALMQVVGDKAQPILDEIISELMASLGSGAVAASKDDGLTKHAFAPALAIVGRMLLPILISKIGEAAAGSVMNLLSNDNSSPEGAPDNGPDNTDPNQVAASLKKKSRRSNW